jgi:hypothetical protein
MKKKKNHDRIRTGDRAYLICGNCRLQSRQEDSALFPSLRILASFGSALKYENVILKIKQKIKKVTASKQTTNKLQQITKQTNKQ